MPDFSRVIRLAYMRILERPTDPGGLASFNQLMNQGLSEAMMREALLRSPEYASKNPDVAATGARPVRGGRKRPVRRVKTSRKR
jgi:hypothetical protein